jgi:hypothetical protein
MPNGNKKGSSFEREICRTLSLWWTGNRDDVFWRASQSGGRATERAKKGKTTFGSYGDIAAVDPIGRPLLDFFTIELKIGKSHGHFGDLLDAPIKKKRKQFAFERTLEQAMSAATLAKSHHWMLISKRDRREPVVFIPRKAWNDLIRGMLPLGAVMFDWDVLLHDRSVIWEDIVGLLLTDFLRLIKPEAIQKLTHAR